MSTVLMPLLLITALLSPTIQAGITYGGNPLYLDKPDVLERLEEAVARLEELQREQLQTTNDLTKQCLGINQTDQSKTSNALEQINPTLNSCRISPSVCDAVITMSNMLSPSDLLKLSTGVYYINANQKMNFNQSKSFCETRNLEAVVIKNASEMEPLRTSLPRGTWVWLAGSDARRASGDFYWADGTQVATELWHKSAGRNEPNNFNAGQETCVYLWSEHHSLGDWPCNDANAAVFCRLPENISACFDQSSTGNIYNIGPV